MVSAYTAVTSKTGEVLLRIYSEEEVILVSGKPDSVPSNLTTPCIEKAGWYAFSYRETGEKPLLGNTMLAYVVVDQLQDAIDMGHAPDEIKQEFSGRCEVLRFFVPTESDPRLFSDNDERYVVRSADWRPLGFIRGGLLSIPKPSDEETVELMEFYREVSGSGPIDPSRLTKVLQFAYDSTSKRVTYLRTTIRETTP